MVGFARAACLALSLGCALSPGWAGSARGGGDEGLFSIDWGGNFLTISRGDLPGGSLRVWYLEAFCRPGSTDRDWGETVVPHETRLVSRSEDGRVLRLRSEVEGGLTVDHEIEALADGVSFRLKARNGGSGRSEAHWAQPCARLAGFVGTEERHSSEEYLEKCFIFVDGREARMPTAPWAKEARYVPGQVWRPSGVPRTDVNPRPLSSIVPSNGLIGCVSGDGRWVFGTAWEPYQELFQGVIVCLHSDFRIGDLGPGEEREIRGRIYLFEGDSSELLRRYRRDFPEHERGSGSKDSDSDSESDSGLESEGLR